MADVRPPTVILAGGLARRMGGGDKPLRSIAGRPLLAHVIERLQPQCGALALNANGDPNRFGRFGLPVIADTVHDFPGPLAGVLAAMDWAATVQPDAHHVLTVPGDCPFLPRDLVARLDRARLAENAEIAVAASGGHLHPVIALWPVALREALRTALLDEDIRKVERFTARYPRAVVEWPVTPFDPFFNANTPEELAEAERIAAGDQ
ncbi:molybdenum cofactor guanylyltransferase MobA [Rhodopseudomonas palustris]|uniref:Molybdenum cofactor guanylyltransferase n=1 Tax=Rhodopseudomonas palustris TaxID=1076 RepID=A0A323UA49_RHOPL|nr:molybdenum cofactor guanylyltransferase MobA [Rhodopseudomonas palustris]PZA09083.1 molybdenum cofactor guanylyltransferase MobA [Rhodopseudomonas palustris]